MQKKIIKGIGSIIAILCFGYIIRMILTIDVNWKSLFSGGNNIALLLFLTVVDVIILYLVAYAWGMLLKFIEFKDVKNTKLASVYIKSNIAKYLPGNVMNLVGRNVIAGQMGFKQAHIAMTTVVEIGLFAMTTMILAILFSIKQIGQFYNIFREYVNYKILLFGVILLVVLVIAILVLLYKKSKFIVEVKKYFTKAFLMVCLKSVTLYSIYFMGTGVLLVVILNQMLGIDLSIGVGFQIVGYYIISYFIGYITPGAPGGMGVRETILILLLSTCVGTNIATVASVIHRVVTVLGDIGIYLINYCVDAIEKVKTKKDNM